MYKCGNCGKSVERNMKKCPHCGVRLSGEKTVYVASEPYDYSVDYLQKKPLLITFAIDIVLILLLMTFLSLDFSFSGMLFAIIITVMLDCVIYPLVLFVS